ncbi:MAG TPA: V-type ATP synthase subunit A [Candidatus Marinimicrobia bacterium]|nr:V-type ATP synthase subunit A [Candidatus Neomarinimicrobiota bacterium]HQE95829.1 V-type ATP synthase subunit A [Candidatus Neomarinimicrobiota bacterium]HQH56224.1 V-type ATP synthase subunit A [Candidatus Neomarinimicrobiota bacterium]HQK11871.1 V-type ATP synthase subunit A [Candidatus Neomarinimicrobiota bacterium]HRS90978.1 V-type ATP synthase subunit A [Candidatus Neomarinimicrobiota bacterium]
MKKYGKITSINGNMITVACESDIIQNEVGYAVAGDENLKAEVIKIQGNLAYMQVFESTKGLRVDDKVEFSGQMLSVQLGPGLLGMVYDGLQNPLHDLAAKFGFFLKRGAVIEPLDSKKEWDFKPRVKSGDIVQAGISLGNVSEGIFEHQIFVPFNLRGEYAVKTIVPEGKYKITETIAVITNEKGDEINLKMYFEWPVKIPITAYREKFVPTEPLVTQTRIIDTFFPISKGGTYCIPGPFGAGKTVLQQVTSRFAEADVVIIAACGERAGEVVETLREFPELTDPRTGRSLMDRTIIICNTSSMPVAARDASVYTAATIGEYYRQMGLNVLLLADSTSRWAQAMRELSGRLEEIPGEEAFPAYLESRIAQFYERAGIVELLDGSRGSLTIGGTVSPAGGNFEEPVTQSTLKVVGAFHGLSRDRSNARRYPAIHPLESWSKYTSFIPSNLIEDARQILFKGNEVHQMMLVVGEEGTSLDDFEIYMKSEFLDAVYLQQNSFDQVDGASSPERQKYVFSKVHEVLTTKFNLTDKNDARDFFNKLRQVFIDWNYIDFKDDEFKIQEQKINQLIKEKARDAKSL